MTKNYLLLLFCIIFITSCKVASSKIEKNTSQIDVNDTTKQTNVSILKKEFVIENLNNISHKVWVYLPPNYHSTSKKFPVIYMHDAQNLFDITTAAYGKEWGVDETLNQLFKNTGKGFIVVGVENGGDKRIEEYTPWTHPKYGGGKGEIYVHFLVNELKPFIDKNYRTKTKAKHTAIIGSSLGGLISFYGGLKYPDVFGKIGALSTSFWFSNKVNDFARENGNQKDTKLYLLVGEKENGPMVVDTKKMKSLLIKTGFPANKIKTKIVAEGQHNETFWNAEFLDTITYLFNL